MIGDKKRITVLACALNAAGIPLCQAADIGQGAAFEEVVVTARKREENIQAVPISITAFTAEDLERNNVKTLADLRLVTPSVQVQPDTFRQDTINITVRGLRNFPRSGIQFDTATAVYINGLYYARTSGLTAALIDVDSVQVLKGPQGTLVGRNATGGAVLYTTREPEDKFGGYVTLTAGDYGRYETQAVVNVPLGEKLAMRAAYSYSETAGYLKNIYFDPATGERNDTPGAGARKTAMLFSLKWLPDDVSKLVLRGDFDAEHYTGSSYHLLNSFEGTQPSTGAIGSNIQPVSRPSICNIPMTCNQVTDLRGRVIAPYFSDVTARTVNTDPRSYNALLNSLARQQAGSFWTIDQAENNYSSGHFQSVSGTYDRSFGSIGMKLMGGYRWTDSRTLYYSRGAPYATLQNEGADPDYNAYTSELTFNGSLLDTQLNWTAGAFFFAESVSQQGNRDYLFSTNQVRPQPVSGRQITLADTTANAGKNTSYAGYGQATYSIRPDLRFTAGVRYSIDERKAHIASFSTRFPATAATTAAIPNSVFNPGTYVFNGISYQGYSRSCALSDANGVLRPIDACFIDVKRTFRDPTWTLSLDYDLFDSTMVYFTSRRGYKSGALNSGANNAAVVVAQPEKVQDYEIGVKSDWSIAGMPVRSNFAAYLTTYKNIQAQAGLPYVIFATGPSGVPCTQALYNAGQCTGASTENDTLNARAAQVYGGEWDVKVKPVPELTLSWNGSYVHAKYTDFSFTPPAGYLQPATGGSLTGQAFPLPAWTMSASATYSVTGEQIGLPVRDLALTASAYNQSNYRTALVGYNRSQQTLGYTLASLRLAVQDIANTNVDLSANVSNLFNTKACYAEFGGTGGGGGVLASTPNATFGVPNTSGVVQCYPLPPRMFALSLRYAF